MQRWGPGPVMKRGKEMRKLILNQRFQKANALIGNVLRLLVTFFETLGTLPAWVSAWLMVRRMQAQRVRVTVRATAEAARGGGGSARAVGLIPKWVRIGKNFRKKAARVGSAVNSGGSHVS